ncbi:MAG: hypothetical protein JJE52_01475 [Acidimicrobiia bacterium]|nr:hypothetical protein [Acidimicrobiia bacterium]
MALGDLLVIVDTCVLMRAGALEFFVRIHMAGGCLLRWSSAIEEEFDGRIGRRPEGVELRCRRAMAAIPDALVDVSEAQSSSAAALATDADDVKIAAAALALLAQVADDPDRWEGAQAVLLTDNVRHFDTRALGTLGVRVLNCDEFAMLLLGRTEALVLRTVDPTREPGHLLEKMRSDGMTSSAAHMERRLRELGLM